MNWNSQGFDLITNFWWKRLKSTQKFHRNFSNRLSTEVYLFHLGSAEVERP